MNKPTNSLLLTIFTLCAMLAFSGCAGLNLVSKERALSIATTECRKGHLVLQGEPTSADAVQMTLAQADEAVRVAGQKTNYDVPMSTTVWLVKIGGTFEVIGGPPLPNRASATPIPPGSGICQVIVETGQERALGTYNIMK